MQNIIIDTCLFRLDILHVKIVEIIAQTNSNQSYYIIANEVLGPICREIVAIRNRSEGADITFISDNNYPQEAVVLKDCDGYLLAIIFQNNVALYIDKFNKNFVKQ